MELGTPCMCEGVLRVSLTASVGKLKIHGITSLEITTHLVVMTTHLIVTLCQVSR